MNIRNLACAVLMQAVRDYFDVDETKRRKILKDLRSTWMETLTEELSIVTAERLEKYPEEIRERLHKLPDE